MRLVLAGLLAAGLSTAGPAPSNAQPMVFPGSDYGQTTLRLRESLGSAVAIVEQNKDVFERIGRLRPDARIREVADKVVRLDRLIEHNGKRSTSTCTGTIVAPDVVMTNYHCIPGYETVLEASILIGYEDEDDPDAVRLPIELTPLASHETLDYAFVRINAPLPAGVEPLVLDPADALEGERLTVLHHPAGRPKMMTSFRCLAYEERSPTEWQLRHQCDTLGGSSGGILINEDRKPVALHHTGGLRDNDPGSYNLSTRMAFVREAFDALQASRGVAVAPVASQPATPAAPTTTAGYAGETSGPSAPVQPADPLSVIHSPSQPGTSASAPSGGNESHGTPAAPPGDLNSILNN